MPRSTQPLTPPRSLDEAESLIARLNADLEQVMMRGWEISEEVA